MQSFSPTFEEQRGIWILAGNIRDGSTGDIAVDHYHRYLVFPFNLLSQVFQWVGKYMRFYGILQSCTRRDTSTCSIMLTLVWASQELSTSVICLAQPSSHPTFCKSSLCSLYFLGISKVSLKPNVLDFLTIG